MRGCTDLAMTTVIGLGTVLTTDTFPSALHTRATSAVLVTLGKAVMGATLLAHPGVWTAIALRPLVVLGTTPALLAIHRAHV